MTQFLRKILLSRVSLHIYFWIFVFLSFSILYIYPRFRIEGIIKNLIYFPADIAFTYFFLYSLNKLITKSKKYLLFIFLFSISIVAYTFLSYNIDQYIIPYISGESKFSEYNLHTFIHSSWVIVMIALAAGYIKMIRTWHRTDEAKINLDLEKTRAHNELLRSKINPHFLFNTLNNISSLIEIDKDKAQKSITELGDLMSYMVYEGESDHVPLEREIKYIRDFISLQELRIDKENFIDFSLNGDPDSYYIASMILIPFVENAFKYCDKTACPGITLKIDIEEGFLNFLSKNPVDSRMRAGNTSGGFGIKNVRQRLEQLYPGNHLLKIDSDSPIYSVRLKVKLDKKIIKNPS